MDGRSDLRLIDLIHEALLKISNDPVNKNPLFGLISEIHGLASPPEPLTTKEMHEKTAELIRGAESTIKMMFYKFDPHSSGGIAIVNALIVLKTRAERTKKKIDVRMIVNSRSKPAEWLYKPNKAFNPDIIDTSDYFNFEIIFYHTLAFGSLHSKVVIVDRCAMIRGGDAVQENNFITSQFETATIVNGSIVSVMEADFDHVWAMCKKEQLSSPIHSGKVVTVEPTIPCIYMAKEGNGNPLAKDYPSPYKVAVRRAISLAKNSICILVSNINDKDICKDLAEACKRGVMVQIVTGKYHNQNTESYTVAGGTNADAMGFLVSQVPRDFQQYLSIRWATDPLKQLVQDNGFSRIHAKYICVDTKIVAIGSSPMDKQGLKFSREADIVFENHAAALNFNKIYFEEKHHSGREYFEDAYDVLLETVAEEIKRIRPIAGNNSYARDKLARLEEKLVLFQSTSSPRQEIIYYFLEEILPIAGIQTGAFTLFGSTHSYNKIYDVANKQGLLAHIKLLPSEQHVNAHRASELESYIPSP